LPVLDGKSIPLSKQWDKIRPDDLIYLIYYLIWWSNLGSWNILKLVCEASLATWRLMTSVSPGRTCDTPMIFPLSTRDSQGKRCKKFFPTDCNPNQINQVPV
jgi:hypothetical protein